MHAVMVLVVLHFNSQPHEEADVVGHVQDFVDKLFQLTASRGG